MLTSNLNFISRTSHERVPNRETPTLGKEILADFSATISSLEPSVREKISPLLNSLQNEDDEFCLVGLLQVGTRLKFEQQEAAAGSLLERLSQADIPTEIREKAKLQFNALAGRGAFGLRAEYFLARLAKDSTDFRTIVPMIGTAMVGEVVGTAFLGRLAGTASRGVLTRGLGAKLLVGSGSFLAEFPTFAVLSRAFSPVPNGSFSDDLFRSALSLGAFRFCGGMGNIGANLARGVAPRMESPLQFLLPQATIFLGLLASRHLEQHYKLRPELEDATTTADVLGSMASLLVGSNLGSRFLGRPFAALRSEMEFRAESFPKFGETKGPQNPFLQLAPVGPERGGGRTPASDSGFSREHLVFTIGNQPSGAGTSGTFPTPEQVATEIASLHRSWVEKGGHVQIAGNALEAKTIDLDVLQTAIWEGKRPIIPGDDALLSGLWGKLKPIFRNLNNPGELYKRDLGHANYLLALSIVSGRPLESITLPGAARGKVPQYPMSPYELLWLRHQLTGSREGLALEKSSIVAQFFGGDAVRANAVAREVLDESSLKRRGWSETLLESIAAKTSLAPEPPRQRTLLELSLNDVRDIIPKEEGGSPRSSSVLTEAVAAGNFEHILRGGHCIGWWTALHKLGAYQANILGLIPEFPPEDVYNLLSRREEWPVFYPGFYLVEKVRPLGSQQAIYRLALKTPGGRVRMFSKQTIVPAEFQVRWEDPSPTQIEGLDLKTEPGDQVVARIQGGITAARTPSGDGSLVLYELFMTARQTNKGGADPFASLQSGQYTTMARVPPILTSVYAKLAANRDGRDWGIYNPPELLAYRDHTDIYKGPEPEGVSYQKRVTVIEK